MDLEESKEFFNYVCIESGKAGIVFLIIILSIWAVMTLWQG